MPRPRGKKKGSVLTRLIEAGEALYGRHGLEGVSLRQICAAAGCGDNYAVQYHFEDAGGLIRAIFARRIPEMEIQRAKRLLQMKQAGTLTTRDLLDCLFRPVIEHRDANGKRAYASFELALLCSVKGAEYYADMLVEMPITQEVLELLRQANPHLLKPFAWYRMQLVSTLVLSSVCVRFSPYDDEASDTAMVENALDMVARAFAAPVGPATAELMQSLSAKSPSAATPHHVLPGPSPV